MKPGITESTMSRSQDALKAFSDNVFYARYGFFNNLTNGLNALERAEKQEIPMTDLSKTLLFKIVDAIRNYAGIFSVKDLARYLGIQNIHAANFTYMRRIGYIRLLDERRSPYEYEWTGEDFNHEKYNQEARAASPGRRKMKRTGYNETSQAYRIAKLFLLDRHPHSAAEFARITGISANNITGIFTKLKKNKYIQTVGYHKPQKCAWTGKPLDPSAVLRCSHRRSRNSKHMAQTDNPMMPHRAVQPSTNGSVNFDVSIDAAEYRTLKAVDEFLRQLRGINSYEIKLGFNRGQTP